MEKIANFSTQKLAVNKFRAARHPRSDRDRAEHHSQT